MSIRPSPSVQPTTPALERERVLIVDDDPSVGVLLAQILGVEGYRCVNAATVGEARTSLEGGSFDVILCDVGLPDGSGLDLVAEAIAADEHLAALVVSGLDEAALGERALQIGAYGYIVKPFSANDVLIGVLGALAHRRRELTAVSEASSETIKRLCVAVEARDAGIAAHITGMSEHCYAIARELGIGAEQSELLRAASPMHDVGKVGVPDRVLLKPGALSEEERALMERHTEIGYRILA